MRSFAVLAFMGLCACATAQTEPVNTIDADLAGARAEAIEAAAVLLEEGYLYEDRGAELASQLRDESERYQTMADPEEFVREVTSDLREWSNDLHLRISQWPRQQRTGGPQALDPFTYQMLDGNIAYLRLPLLSDPDGTLIPAFDAAMGELAGADAVIIDLRDTPGGDPQTVRHVSSYFFAESTHLVSTRFRGMEPMERWTVTDLPSPIFADQPVYILMDGGTASGGESFSFGMRATDRALLVGENTAGAGHIGGFAQISDNFALFVPRGRTYNPRTGEGWEATGIVPDISVASEDALDAALAHFASTR